MGRVSLTESYDDRSVIAKLNEMDKRVTENTTVVTAAEASAQASAAAAQETADRFAGSVGAVVQNANAQIDASKAQVDQAKAEVDETVTTVAQAVQTANQASASAQQSATTVAGYDTRLTETETKNSQQDTAIGALQTADTQNVKINRINEYAIGLTGNQNSTGTKGFSAIKTPLLKIENNFRPVVYYGNYDATDVQTTQRIRPITVFTSPDSTERPILRIETIDDASMTGVELTSTIYNKGIDRSIAIYVKKSDGMSYVTAPSRGSTNVSDYSSNEVVTIDTLRKLGVIQ